MEALLAALGEAAPLIKAELEELAERWLAPTLRRLDRSQGPHGLPKTFNDPVWGTIELMPWETLLLDSPLLQRLKGVRQLGMAHLVYPSAVHDRLEHSRGVVEAAERMIRALERNAASRRRFVHDPGVPAPSEADRVAIRLAGLLHDIGHGPFSHATEMLLFERRQADFSGAEDVFRRTFAGVTKAAPGEVIAALLVLSPAMQRIFAHPHFGAGVPAETLTMAIVARILGSRSCLDAGYLSGVISGPLDADKLDYMARDCHHAGLPLGLDVQRLIAKLEVVAVRPDNAPNPELRARAEAAPGRCFYEIGIAQAGLGAYEQMVIGRVILYDRIYYHHKVRAAEGMARRMIVLAEQEMGRPYALTELFAPFSDDTMVSVISGELHAPNIPSGGPRARELAVAFRSRDIYYRAQAIAARYIAGLDTLPRDQQADARALAWRRLLRALSDEESRFALEAAIYARAVAVGTAVPALAEQVADLRPEHVLCDLPMSRSVVRGGDILTRTDNDRIGTPNLFFDPERWSQAYEYQKQSGFVYAPRERVPLIAMATRLVLYEQYGLVMGEAADRAAKTTGRLHRAWAEAAYAAGVIHADALEVAAEPPRMALFTAFDLDIPDARRVAAELNAALPGGLPAPIHAAVVDALRWLVRPENARSLHGQPRSILPGRLIVETTDGAWPPAPWPHEACGRVGFALRPGPRLRVEAVRQAIGDGGRCQVRIVG